MTTKSRESLRELIDGYETQADDLRARAESAEGKAERTRDELRKLTGCDCYSLRIQCDGHEKPVVLDVHGPRSTLS